ncbi:hypothetical protein FD46_GL001653 [Liquorilactobacillus oeni DSM 19972]|uniref:Uncharacterized protein n=1 Tax=Liquorilactobacillus oeni DSM 19972 TaxID=1423777 RepID=A0A0R1MHE7_9LACO|nr:hypothetical protein FD46_GL001653 [Liquorilactobacillus oeni DSM 19972]
MQTAFHCAISSRKFISVPRCTNSKEIQIVTKFVPNEACETMSLGNIVQKPITKRIAVTNIEGIYALVAAETHSPISIKSMTIVKKIMKLIETPLYFN